MSKKGREIIDQLKNSKLPVIIAGAGIVGKVLYSVCKKEGVKVECFCDSSEKVAGGEFCGLKVWQTANLRQKFPDANILISAAAIKDVVDLLSHLGFRHWKAGGLLLDDWNVDQKNEDASLDYEKYAIENCILCHKGFLNPEKIFIRSIDIIITERCSLKCKECSNLMQYYEKPQNCDLKSLFAAIDNFCLVSDEIMDLRVIGGEPFMNPQCPEIVKKLTAIAKAKRVAIFTNGTILPTKEGLDALKHRKIRVIISDYGKLSRNLPALVDMLKHNGIIHHVLEIKEWISCSSIKPRRRNPAQLAEIFCSCCAKNMATLSDGKIFRCPYAANAFRLSAVKADPEDYIDLMEGSLDKRGIKVKKEKLKQYFLHKKYLSICNYCNGRPLAGKDVPPAVQIEKPLKYIKYRND